MNLQGLTERTYLPIHSSITNKHLLWYGTSKFSVIFHVKPLISYQKWIFYFNQSLLLDDIYSISIYMRLLAKGEEMIFWYDRWEILTWGHWIPHHHGLGGFLQQMFRRYIVL
ncbi:hypothetical protein ACJX0J_007823 [Zea mays]